MVEKISKPLPPVHGASAKQWTNAGFPTTKINGELEADHFSTGLAGFEGFIKAEFTPRYRDWLRNASRFIGEIEEKLGAGEITAKEEVSGGTPQIFHTEEEAFQQFIDENHKPITEEIFQVADGSGLSKLSRLMLKICSHRVSGVVTGGELNNYNYQLGKYLLGRGDKPLFDPPSPEALEQHLVERAKGKVRVVDNEQFRYAIEGDVEEHANVAIKSRGDAKSIKIKTIPFTSEKGAWYEKGFLGEAISELAVNASHFVPEKGGEITLRGAADDETVSLSVQDNGSGISRGNLLRIFDENFTTRPRSVDGRETGGLGLHLVKSIMGNVFKGKIVVESNGWKFDPQTGELSEGDLKKGTRFTITYPNKPPKGMLTA